MPGLKVMRIAVTGAGGNIGSVLMKGLNGFELSAVNRCIDGTSPRDYEAVTGAFRGHDTVIQLAWIKAMGPPPAGLSYSDLLPADNRHTENLAMNARIMEAAMEAGVRRVILASSVHADNFYDWCSPGFLTVERVPRPTGPYGAAKVLLEEQGKYYASRGLEVICARLGAVTPDGRPDPADRWERHIWLSHRDCVEMMKSCLEALEVPGRFSVFYAVSNNEGRVHATDNPFDWRPLDGAGESSRHNGSRRAGRVMAEYDRGR